MSKEHIMRQLTAGSRVWVRDDDQVRFGVVKSIATTHSYLRIKGSMVIVMGDGHRVMATTMATRGTVWDVVRKDEPVQGVGRKI
jgi:hypothetical protein